MKRELLLAVAATLLCSSSVMAETKACTTTQETCYGSNNQAGTACTVTKCTYYPSGRTTTVVKEDHKQRPVNPPALTAGSTSTNKATAGDLGGSPSKTPTSQTGLLPTTAGKTLGSGGPPQTSTKPLR
jgi:hypothetical protein